MEQVTTAVRFLSILLFLIAQSSWTSALSDDRRSTYIIHMDKSKMPAPFSTHHSWYTSTLSSLSSADDQVPPPTHLYTYNHAISGFSAVLSRSQLQRLEKMPGHLATYEETFGKAHTTHTPEYLGLDRQRGLWPISEFGDDMIIGIVDTGIWPESRSFNDDGMPPVPSRWRGTCESGTEFNSSHCNRKLIGARKFSEGIKQAGLNISKTDDYDSPRDFYGHGTHTSSTAAGSQVPFANHFGYANGTATGIAPRARLAMYKVLYFNDTFDSAASDTLAGIDQAIEDGVDLLSLSLGFFRTPFYTDPIAIGTFAAMERGIFVSVSAGNGGPHAYTVINGAPWFTSVGAGTIDRNLSARVTLGNGEVSVIGNSVYPENLLVDRVPIYYGHGNRSKEICNSLDPKDVRGKYIFCDFNDQISVFSQLATMYDTGAAGAIFSTDSGQFLRPDDFDTPFVTILPKDGELVKKYLTESRNPTTVSIKFQETVLGTGPAPQVAYFSSRGPVLQAPWILKPDVLAPGVDVLAAWTPNRASATRGDDFLLGDYRLVSGTSMASPHVVGLAALLKATHKDWSPAAIRSAMMTTADILDNTNGTIIDMTTGIAGTPLDYGAGHVNPNKAMNPGLVYDANAEDYINFLCGLNYTIKQIQIITQRSNFSCGEAKLDLNYPSFIVILNNTNTTSYTFERVLTNVADMKCTYHALIEAPSGMKVLVQPATVYFSGKYSTATFNLTVDIDLGHGLNSDYIGNYGYLSWYEENGTRIVRSPIVSAFGP